MTQSTADPAVDLALQIRADLSDLAPQGFNFSDHLLRQDAVLERLSQHLRAHPDAAEVERAIAHALDTETDQWVLLKLVELSERLSLPGTAQALHGIAQRLPHSGDRGLFLSGRACEVLLKLPLDLGLRAEANRVCQIPLQKIAEFRHGEETQRLLYQPRRFEWALLILLMLAALGGLLFAYLPTRAP